MAEAAIRNGNVSDRAWVAAAVARLESESCRSADTHLVRLLVTGGGCDVYLKDETSHPTGSLKHRLARSLFLHAICNGWVGPNTTIVEASSGSTAISEAWFARFLELRFIAVVPEGTAKAKLGEIERLGGECRIVPADEIYSAAAMIAEGKNGHYMNQFTYAERATDWRGNNSIGESIFRQLACERHPEPEWIVTGAGTGGTSATLGRFIRYRPPEKVVTRLAVVDPEGSVFAQVWRTGSAGQGRRGRIEGIGRPRLEPSFLPDAIDRMIEVPDISSFAAARLLSRELGRKVGPSTGTNFVGVIELLEEAQAKARAVSIVSLICDPGERYLDTLFDENWLMGEFPELAAAQAEIAERWDICCR